MVAEVLGLERQAGIGFVREIRRAVDHDDYDDLFAEDREYQDGGH